MSTNPEPRSLDSLTLSWPESVRYHSDQSRRAVSNPSGNREARTPGTGSQKPVTTYNGLPRALLRRAQTLLVNEIRVLDLAQGRHGDPLVGSLRKVRLSGPIVYEPLSYTWEDYDNVESFENNSECESSPTIFLSNVESFMNIGTNCKKALCSVRKATAERTIWIDSICVNQDDPEERSRQVDLMQRIFARAFTVLIYLGQESKEHNSSMAMSLLGRPGRLRELDGLDHDERTSLKHLFERHYFRRMWIVQEVALAKTLEVHCGPATAYVSTFAGKPLEAILGSRIAHPPWLKHSKHTLISPPKLRTSSASQAQHILSLMLDTASCHCKDDRDRIFALASLVHVSDKEWLMADYSLSTAQVYTGIAAFLATNFLAWDVLILAPRLALNSYLGLPSWVPNWKMLSNASLEAPKLLEFISSKGHGLGSQAVAGVARSGVITIQGKVLGPVTPYKYGQDHMFQQRARMRQDQEREAARLFNSCWEPNGSKQLHGKQSIWTLTKAAQFPAQDSWECHIEFVTRCEPPSNAQHIAVMLQDYLTVLILRLDDSPCDHYTLVETGMPLVWGVMPEEWAFGVHPQYTEVSLQILHRPTFSEDFWLHGMHSEQFPRLRDYPELWSYNPATSAMSLTHRAVKQAGSINLRALSLWLEWQKHAHDGVQILRDKTRLQLLIDEVNLLGHEEYRQIEQSSGLGPSWSLEHFLGLFIKDPSKTEPMEWPEMELTGDQVSEGADTLSLLMQWAGVTYQFLRHLRATANEGVPWLRPKSPSFEDPYSDAMSVVRFQLSMAPVVTDRHETCRSDRASFLLQKILHQSSELPSQEFEQETRTCSEMERYWDWEKFEFAVEERLSILRHLQPEIELLQPSVHSAPDFRLAVQRQILAAHGVDLSNLDFIEIPIR